jgi:hypothetical protein
MNIFWFVFLFYAVFSLHLAVGGNVRKVLGIIPISELVMFRSIFQQT